ncbi:hypothetical protein JCM5350_004135, partial [Sporobolomyces pararoseus]
ISATAPPRRSQTLPSTSTSTSTFTVPPTTNRHSREATVDSKDLTRRLSFPDARLQDETLSRLNRWIIGFVLVDFDVDTGPNLDNNYPHFVLPQKVQKQLAFSSLPEGDLPLSVTENGYSYSWRISYPQEEEELKRCDEEQGEKVLRLPCSNGIEENDGGLYGYVWFSQEQNSTLRRNYSQRSLVLLTHHPHLPGLFSSVLEILGPLHFLHAKQSGAKGGMVESACLNISSWPPPNPGSTLELPLLGSVLNVALPLPNQAQYPTLSTPTTKNLLNSTSLPPPILPATHPLTPLCLLLLSPQSQAIASSSSSSNSSNSPTPNSSTANSIGFTKLLLLWELLVLEEPLLVFVNDPKTGSELLAHLRNLIRPMPFKGELKLYFHIHDPSFPVLCRPGSKPPPGLLLSSTNPLVLKNCQKTWAHILRLDRPSSSNQFLSPPTRSNSLPPPGTSNSTLSVGSGTNSRTTSPAISPLIGRRKGVFDEPIVESSSSRSSSRNRMVSNGSVVGDNWSNYSSSGSRSSSPVSFLSNNSPKPNPSFLSTSPTKKPSSISNGTSNARERDSWWGLKSERKRHIKKDDQVAKLIETKFKEGDYLGCDEAIYRYFASLTEKLLSPVTRYLLTAHNPSSTDFLLSLKTHGTPLPLKQSTNPFSSISFSQPGTTSVERFYLRVWDTQGMRSWREGWERERNKVIRREAEKNGK